MDPSEGVVKLSPVPQADIAPYIAAGGNLFLATVALFNADGQIRSQRRELTRGANREIAYECVD